MVAASQQQRAIIRLHYPTIGLRSVRPSLVDLRFTGDPWVVHHADGTSSLCLDDYCLTSITTLALDVPCLNRTLHRLRASQARRRPCLRLHRSSAL
jgi:hypothetical protein